MRLTGKDFLTSERMQPKVTAPIRFPRFFVTSPAPCPYLPGKSERKVFTELRGDNADELNEALGRIGKDVDAHVQARRKMVEARNKIAMLSPREREARKGRNPRTGETVDVPAKRVPYFKPGKEMRNALNEE